MKNGPVVGSPLTPTSLVEMKALGAFPPPPAEFAPDGNWTMTYRIWTCHGYRDSGNEDRGFLRIRRICGEPGGPFRLKIDRQVNHDGANIHIIHAEITCLGNELASPAAWTLSSRFIGPDAKPRKDLDATEEARVGDGSMEITVNGTTSRRKVSERLTADWCLFEAVGRRPFAGQRLPPFDMLEGLSLVRANHRLSYRGVYTMKTSTGNVQFHWFQQLGNGTWPYEYWLDENHRLLMAVTNSRAYLLDEKAVEAIRQREIRSRQYEQRKRRQRKGRAV